LGNTIRIESLGYGKRLGLWVEFRIESLGYGKRLGLWVELDGDLFL